MCKMKNILFSLLLLTGALLMAGQETIWHSVASMKGFGVRQTDIFPTRGSRIRARYKVRNSAGVTLKLVGTNGTERKLVELRKGVFHGDSTRSTHIPVGMKRGYLRLVSDRLDFWEFNVEQYVSSVDDWELLQAEKEQPVMTKFGVWCGEGGDEREQQFEIPSSHWRITAQLLKPGKLFVELLDEDGVCIFRDQMTQSGESISWGHKKGSYTIRIAADEESPWTVKIDMN